MVACDAGAALGRNPFFKNKHRTVVGTPDVSDSVLNWAYGNVLCVLHWLVQEPYLMNEFKEDFYGQTLHLLVCGFLRSQADFANLGMWNVCLPSHRHIVSHVAPLLR